MIIKEYDFLQYKDELKPHYITPQNFEAIEKFVLENEPTAEYLKLTTKKGFGKVLQAQNFVGVIQTKDGTTIEILPKIFQNDDPKQAKEILFKMLRTLRNSPFRSFNSAHLQSAKMPLFEIFITMFLDELAKLIQRGIKSDYLAREENLPFLKGKLKMGEHIKQNFIHKERFFVEYEEFSSDRVENRLIKSSLQYLYKRSTSNRNQQRIREFLFVFDSIAPSVDFKTDFSKVKLNRQMRDYEQVLIWCKTFLENNSFSPYKGNDLSFALLFDMNLLFESYVAAYLRRQYEHITTQDKTHHLAYENGSGKFRLKPDIVIYHDGQMIIADTKWKILDEVKTNNGVSQSDMYQLYAYGTKYEQCKDMYLIYPKNKEVSGNHFHYFNQSTCESNQGLNLKVVFFDLLNNKVCDDSLCRQ
ncbi:MAG: McrC family protein [Sulfuricurvum sp.]|uniref:McrC family protein n=1 Tax=Sulfuricurvum sp. TaxID=2025608 RepID=UPI0026323A2E|nr:McrC family protein [Sulfuricurvum sp.]MDD2828713.1 McrC family protein [Sulfuricurvum sp.]MDD4949291.1 McrC family protein [Sulfuricurvum sp.]